MQTITAEHTHFIYRFRVNPDHAIAFQTWAQTRGMVFWQQLPGVIRYRTFRQDANATISEVLSGQRCTIDVISQVEMLDRKALDRIIDSTDFQCIQQELLEFVIPDSLEYSILNCAYDSSIN